MAKNKNPKKRITAQQKLFIDYYISNNFNATDAAKKAKYSEKTARVTASRLLTLPYIQDYLSMRIKKTLGSTDLLSVQLIGKLKEIAFSDLSDVAEWDRDKGVIPKDSKGLSKKNSYSISEVSSKFNRYSESYDFSIKQADKLKAIDMLARFVKLYEDNKPDNEEDKKLEVEQLSKQERTEMLLDFQEKLNGLKGNHEV